MQKSAKEILKQYWGYDSFRPLQEDIIASVLSGHDTLGLLPTGGGKSITFQVPAIALGGLCLVVTPLISLMKDQIDHLTERGVKAASVFMGMTHQEVLETYERVISQGYQFLYVSPERLETQLFKAKLQYMNVRLLVVDEAHCISQWGYDFRPPYLRIADIRELLHPGVPCLALTATATPVVVKDIQDKLSFRKGSQVFKASFVRPNLTYNVFHIDDKDGTMYRLLKRHKLTNEQLAGVPQNEIPGAIVYVRNRRKSRDIADTLSLMGVPVNFYHAGLSTAEKQKRQDDWMSGKVPVIVATNAFGMGIDKPNVRLVIHIDLPPSPEEYFQEAGRAGRDGQPSEAWMLVASNDKKNLLKHLQDEYPERDYIRMVYQRLANFFQIAIGAGCNSSFEFDIVKFCRAYDILVSKTHYAIRILAHAGYIIYNEEPERHSRVMITTTRERLYHLEKFDRTSQKVLTALLRLYPGLFADFIYIREEDIMSFTGLSQEELYQNLLLLTRFHILHYVPARQMPAIVYLTPRLDNDELRIPRAIYEDRRARQEERMMSMVKYIEKDDECRLRYLLRYFGEEIDEDCGSCDVCKTKAGESRQDVNTRKAFIRQQIITILKAHGSLSSTELFKRIDFNPSFIGEVIHEMLADEELEISDSYLVSLNESE